MKNRIQKAFSRDFPEKLHGTIIFDSNQDFKDFQEKLDIVSETGKPQKAKGVKQIKMSQDINGKSYPQSELSFISDMTIYPNVEEEEIPVTIESGTYLWKFKKMSAGKKAILENADILIPWIRTVRKHQATGVSDKKLSKNFRRKS